jgi:hypothetical protein
VTANHLGMLLASAPVRETITNALISNYGPLAGCLEQHYRGGTCGTSTAAILAQVTTNQSNSSVLVVMDAALPQGLEAHQDAFFLESSALTAIEALPFPPPRPSPPLPCELRPASQQCVLPPAPPAKTCYKLGTELCGLCEITSKTPLWHIVMQCGAAGDPGSVIADYADAGGWAGQFGDRFGGLRRPDVPCTQIRLEYTDRWNITLTHQGKDHSWALAPKGYLPPENVTGIACGPKMACPSIDASNEALRTISLGLRGPQPQQVDYGCVSH